MSSPAASPPVDQEMPLLRAGDPGYDEARSIFNGAIDRHPALYRALRERRRRRGGHRSSDMPKKAGASRCAGAGTASPVLPSPRAG